MLLYDSLVLGLFLYVALMYVCSLMSSCITVSSHCYIFWVQPPLRKDSCSYLNKLFIKQVKSIYVLLNPDPFIFLCSLHNTEYIKATVLQDISIKVKQLSHSLFISQVISVQTRFYTQLYTDQWSKMTVRLITCNHCI